MGDLLSRLSPYFPEFKVKEFSEIKGTGRFRQMTWIEGASVGKRG